MNLGRAPFGAETGMNSTTIIINPHILKNDAEALWLHRFRIDIIASFGILNFISFQLELLN